MFFPQLHKVFIFFSFFFPALVSNAQNKITIRSAVDKNKIVIGEQIHFTLEADFSPQVPMSFFTIDSIPHFEILERKKIDTVDDRQGIKLSQSLTLTSFDSGQWVIPSFELPADKPMYTDSVTIDVGFSPFDPNQDYHDIKDVIDVPVVEKKEETWYWYAAASALLVAAIIYFLLRKRKKPVAKVPFVDPYKEAKRELEKLRKENLSSKPFYTRLVDIFRLYISRRKGIASLQKTTDDLVVQLRSLKLPPDEFNHLAQSLRLSDFVKFAKFEPAESDRADSFKTIAEFIENIERIEKIEMQKAKQNQS
jgi:hypothetical protein